MQREVREIALRHGLAVLGPNCMGMIDRTSNSAVYIGDINPWAPRGHVAGIAQSGSVTDAFIHFGTRIGFSRIIGGGQRGRPRRVRLRRLLPRRPRDRRDHPVRRGLQAARTVPRPGRSGAGDGQADPGPEGRPQRRRPRRQPSPTPVRWPARPGRPTRPWPRPASFAAPTSMPCSKRPSCTPAAAGSAGAWARAGPASSPSRPARPR